jgi:putative phage-type endonuclease
MSNTEIENDISHIMEEIIVANDFSSTLTDKDTENEVKKMTLIILSEIYDRQKMKIKKIINQKYKNIKHKQDQNHFIKDESIINEIETDVKKKDTIQDDKDEQKIKKKEKIINIDININSNNTELISPINISEDVCNLKNQDIIIVKDIKPKVERKKIKKKTQINYEDFLKNLSLKDYNYCHQLINEWENKKKNEKINYLTNQVEYLANLPQPEQRSEEWYKFRKGMLTASDLYKAIGTEGIRRALIIKKCKNNTGKSSGVGSACKHGIKYEDIAILIYEKIKNVKIFDYGCIQDKDFKIFGASPDGICGKGSGDMIGTMLEIKCPTTRQIIEGEVPDMYWKQIQGQLEVCKLWECDFLECKIIECKKEEFEKSSAEKGIVIDILYNDTNNTGFIYAPLNLFPDNYQLWLDNELDKIIDNDNITFLKISYWILDKMNCVKVERDPYWFYSHKPEIQKFWDEVLHHRENGYEILEKKTKKRRKNNIHKYDYQEINECIIQSDSE